MPHTTHVMSASRALRSLIDPHAEDEQPVNVMQCLYDVGAKLRQTDILNESTLLLVDRTQDNQSRQSRGAVRIAGLIVSDGFNTAFDATISDDSLFRAGTDVVVGRLKKKFRTPVLVATEAPVQQLARNLADSLFNDEHLGQRERIYAKLLDDERPHLKVYSLEDNWHETRPCRNLLTGSVSNIARKFINTLHSQSSNTGVQFRHSHRPTPEAVLRLCDMTLRILLLNCEGADPSTFCRPDHISETISNFQRDLSKAIEQSLLVSNSELSSAHAVEEANLVAFEIVNELPRLLRIAYLDAVAGYNNDPSVSSAFEYAMLTPGIRAITIYRIAHELEIRDIPLLPRLMSEEAHSRYGIDIHPGACIDVGFTIDHGTGCVIGQTAVIGKNCVVYQNTTLGAINFPRDENGLLLCRGSFPKRHPTLEDNVIVYSNTSILGGDTVIGRNSIIGANVRLTRSVPQESIVTATLLPVNVSPREAMRLAAGEPSEQNAK